MTAEIALVLFILAVALVLFVTEWIRMDVVALLVLGATALTGLVDPIDALSGFSNPAVITVWAMFMLSAALARTGVASAIGTQVLRMVGTGEFRAIIVIMVTAAVLSAFMNNIGVAALLLPVVMDIARKTGRSPSRLLMPLAYGCLLGGLTTLIGTPPNLLASEALASAGLATYSLFDFAPLGGIVALSGIVFVATVGRRILPAPDAVEIPTTDTQRLPEQYGLQERAVIFRVRDESPLIGRTLADTRVGSAADVNVLAVLRSGVTYPAPVPETVLHQGDRLLITGKLDRFEELKGWRDLVVERKDLGLGGVISDEIGLAELAVAPESSIAGQTLGQCNFRQRFGSIVVAIARGSELRYDDLARTTMQAGDRLLVQARREQLDRMRQAADFRGFEQIAPADLTHRYGLEGRLFTVRVPPDSVLVGRTLAESRLGDAFRLGALGIVRDSGTLLLPEPGTALEPNDRLLLRGEPDDVTVLRGLQELELESRHFQNLPTLESEEIGLLEVMLSPRTSMAGSTLRELRFRERYGLRTVAILREGKAIRTHVGDLELRFGDALLLLGPREKLGLIIQDPDFLVLTADARAPIERDKAWISAMIMIAAMGTVLLGWLPIALAAVVGATLMVLSGCLSMEAAYRSVEWRAIFLIAGMLPLGTALQNTGAAAFLADQMLASVGSFGVWGVVIGLYLITALATMIIPTAALIVLMSPIVLRASSELGVSPHSLMMAVAIAASASFTSPISHPANLLVMGPGGYRFADYVKLGVPLTLLLFVVTMLLLPLFWPF